MAVMGIMIAILFGLCVYLVEQLNKTQQQLKRVVSIVRSVSQRVNKTNVETAQAFRVLNESIAAAMGVETEEQTPPLEERH